MVIPWTTQTQDIQDDSQEEIRREDSNGPFMPSESLNYKERYGEQTRKHYAQTQLLHKEIFPYQNFSEESCSDTCCQSKRQLRFLQGLQYLLEDSSGESLSTLQNRHDQILGSLILSQGFNQLRKKYIKSLQGIKDKNTLDETISIMEQMLLVDKILEKFLQEDSFLGTLTDVLSQKHDLSSKAQEYFQCRSQDTEPTIFCQMFQNTQNKISFNKIIRGLLNTLKLQSGDDGQSMQHIYETAKKSLNRGLPANLMSSSGKEALLKTVLKSNQKTISQDFGRLNPDDSSELLEEMLQNLEDIKSNITSIRSYDYYSYIGTHKDAELNKVHEHCDISREKAHSCNQQKSPSVSSNTENFDQGILGRRLFSKFDDAFNEAFELKNSEYLHNVVSNTGPEFFFSTTAPKCDLPFCGEHNPYFQPSLNAVSYKNSEACSSLKKTEVNRDIGSIENEEGDDGEWLDTQEKRLSNTLVCALNQIFPPPPPAMKRMRTLNFMSRKLAKNFHTYGLSSDREKAHFLAQIVHETAGLSSTIENRSRTSAWKKVLNDTSPQWACNNYLDAIEKDKYFFDNHYKHSKNRYKSTFRGRGLVQLTGCNNYLQFFYHKAAVKAGRMDLAYKKVTFYHQGDWDDEKIDFFYCSADTLRQVSQQFERDGLTLEPSSLVNDFENTVNQLALPCKERGVPPMSSQEFLVDSSLWYWKKNCKKDYEKSIHLSPAKSVAQITQCVHGRVSAYKTFNRSSCNANGTPKKALSKKLGSKAWYLDSFCHRLKSFKALDDCLGEQVQE